MCLNKLLSYDGKIYRWRGCLKELKSFVEQYLKLYGSWTSPGVEAKVFRSEQSDFAIKWYGVTSEKIVIQADNEDRYLELLFRNMVSSHENNGFESPAEVITLDEWRPVGELTAEIGAGTVVEAKENVCDHRPQETSAKTVNEVCVVENDRFIAQKACCCNCTCGSTARVELEGLKLSMTILETRLNNARFLDEIKSELSLLKAKQNDNSASVELEGLKLSMTILETRLNNAQFLDEIKSELNVLKAKQNDMERVIRHQDELIGRINEENMFLRSKLHSFEYSTQCDENNNSQGSLHHATNPSDKLHEQLNNVSLHSINTTCIDMASNNKSLPRDKEFVNSRMSLLTKEKGKLEASISRCEIENEAISQLKNENIALKARLQSERKSSTPCPFLKRHGWCVKGDNCGFQHPTSRRNYHKQNVPCPFLRKNGFCLKGNNGPFPFYMKF